MKGAPEGAPLILAVCQRVLERGGHPWLRIDLDEATEVFYKHASDAQLDFVSNIERQFVEEIDASIGVWTQTNTKALTNIDPAKQSRAQAVQRPIRERFMERAAKQEIRWVGTVYPTSAFAQDAEMSLREFEEFVYSAALVHEPDPIAAWQAVSRDQQQLID
jgi:aminopeptidase